VASKSDPSARFVLELDDETSGSADAAASSLDAMKESIDGGLKNLRAMQTAMRNLKSASTPNIEAMNALKLKIDAQKESIAGLQAKYIELGGTFQKSSDDTDEASDSLSDLMKAAKGLPGPLGSIAGKLGSVGGIWSLLLKTWAASIALLAGVVVAIGAVYVALGRYAIAQSDARRSELLHLEGLTTLRNRFGIAAGSATELQQAIDRVSSSSALNRERIGGMTEELYRAGLRGAALEESLQSLAMVEQVQGAAGVARMRGRIIMEARAGRSAQRLADIQARLGGIAARQMLSLDVQSAKLRENVSRIFSGLQLEGALRALQLVTSLFSQSTASGRALKQIVEVLFQPLLNTIEEGGPAARRFFQGMILGAQELVIAILEVAVWWRRTFGGSDMLKNVDMLELALQAGRIAVYAIVIGLVLFVGALAAITVVLGVVIGLVGSFVIGLLALPAIVAASIASIIAFFAAAPAAVIAAIAAIGYGVKALWDSFDWASLGRSIVSGLLAGLAGGGPTLTGAITSIATSIQSAFASALEIHSPSRVFAELGAEIPAGVAEGIDAGAAQANDAASNMVDASGGAGGSDRGSITINELHVHADGDAESIAVSVREALIEILEGLQHERGAPA
jgi:hypothetical protein